jgi:hypothetical protein
MQLVTKASNMTLKGGSKRLIDLFGLVGSVLSVNDSIVLFSLIDLKPSHEAAVFWNRGDGQEERKSIFSKSYSSLSRLTRVQVDTSGRYHQRARLLLTLLILLKIEKSLLMFRCMTIFFDILRLLLFFHCYSSKASIFMNVLELGGRDGTSRIVIKASMTLKG